MVEKKLKLRDVQDISIDSIRIPDNNPNRMSEWEFTQLMNTIKKEGFDEPIKVVPDTKFEEGSGRYLCISGNHRLRAAEQLGYETIPCVVETEWDQMQADAYLVRRNLIRGQLDSKKLRDMVSTSFGDLKKEEIAALMGFESAEKLMKRAKMADTSVFDKEQTEQIENSLKQNENEIEMIDGLHGMLASIFEQYGTDVQLNFIGFILNRKLQLLVKLNESAGEKLNSLIKYCKENNLDMSETIESMIDGYLDSD